MGWGVLVRGRMVMRTREAGGGDVILVRGRGALVELAEVWVASGGTSERK